MKIIDKSEYEFELDNHERNVLEEAAKIVAEITLQMGKRDCTELISGYDDCPYTYNYDVLVETYQMLNEIASAHTIC